MIDAVKFRTIFTIILSALILIGCGQATPEPTPTPTKTPIPKEDNSDESTEPTKPTNTQGNEVDSNTSANDNSVIEATPVPVTNTPIPVESTPIPTERPANIAPYTGLSVANPDLLRRRPLLICVTNDAVGRNAHHGLSFADVVYEYIVDGFTTTRITGLYQSRETDRIGPVRSARFPNIWMAYMYDGALACSGGTDEIRYILRNEVSFPYLDADIDDPSNNRYFYSLGTDYRTRMQTSTSGVRRWLNESGRDINWFRPGFEFSEEAPTGSAGSANTIRIAYPGGNSVEWRYDPGQQGYLRFQGGQQQIDLVTEQPILAQNVIAITAEHELTDIVEDSLGTKSVDIKLYGFGDFRIMRNGLIYEGTWRADPENPPRWLGPGEVIIRLKPGQSWIQVVRDRSEISFE